MNSIIESCHEKTGSACCYDQDTDNPQNDSAGTKKALKRILFIGESGSLSHITRPLVLAQSLNRSRYDIHFAGGPEYKALVKHDFPRYTLPAMSSEEFRNRLAWGKPLYTRDQIQEYVKAELRLMKEIMPDLVVGDFRISLSISCELLNIPYVSLANANWSPYSTLTFPIPEHPVLKILGTGSVTRFILNKILPYTLQFHVRDFNAVRTVYGLRPFENIQEMYTHGDWTLYPDFPDLAPTSHLPDHHHYLGPVIWSPDLPVPEWWDRVPMDHPLIYISMGTTGCSDIVGTILKGVRDLPVTVLLATADRYPRPDYSDDRLFTAPFIPIMKIGSHVSCVVSNGGNSTCYQALSHGIPVLSIPSNADQYFTAESMVRCGTGKMVRSGTATSDDIREAVQSLLKDPLFRENAAKMKASFKRYNAPALFQSFIDTVFESGPNGHSGPGTGQTKKSTGPAHSGNTWDRRLGQYDVRTKLLDHMDRLGQIKRGERPFPFCVSIAPSNLCNHRCLFCEGTNYLKDHHQLLETDVIKKLLDDLSKENIQSVIWTGGGEPLAHKDISTLITRSCDMGFANGMISNFSLAHPEIIDCLTGALSWLRVSCNGGNRTTYREIHGVDHFDRVVGNIRQIREKADTLGKSLPISLSMVFRPDNIASLGDLVQMAADLSLDSVHIRPDQFIDPSWLETTEVRQALAHARNMAAQADSPLGFTTSEYVEKQYLCQYPEKCYAHFMSMCITASGDVAFCRSKFDSPETFYGNIHDQSISAIWRGSRVIRMEESIRPSTCAGFCRQMHVNVHTDRMLHVPAELKTQFI